MVKKSHQITVAIITRDRDEDFLTCLQSVLNQSYLPQEILIIDASKTQQIKQYLNNFIRGKKYQRLSSIHYLVNRKKDIVAGRNLALKKCQTNWLAFIDDDCVADSNWLKAFYQQIIKDNSSDEGNVDQLKNVAYLGSVETKYPKNIFSLTTHFFNDFWRKKSIKKNKQRILDLEILDTKNIVYNLNFLKKKKIFFSADFFISSQYRSEDSDLGMQIEKQGGKAAFVPSALVKHRDPINWKTYFQKLIVNTSAHAQYEVKWQVFRKNKFSPQQTSFFSYFWRFISRYRLNFFKITFFVIVLFISGLIKIFIKLFYRLQLK